MVAPCCQHNKVIDDVEIVEVAVMVVVVKYIYLYASFNLCCLGFSG